MTKLSTWLLAAALTVAASAEDPSRAEVLAAGCHACHGVDGQGSPPVPALRGRQDIQQQLRAFKNAAEATGEAHLMIRFARGLSDRDIAELADFYARAAAP